MRSEFPVKYAFVFGENFDQTFRQGQASAMLASKLAIRSFAGEDHDISKIM